MLIKGTDVSAMSVDDAISEANSLYDGNIVANGDVTETTGRNGLVTVKFHIRVLDSRGMGASVSGIGTGRERHGVAACWHAWRDVIAGLFIAHPDAVTRGGMVPYNGARDFLRAYPFTGYTNIGSMVQPVQANESCDCHTHDNEGPIVRDLMTRVNDAAKAKSLADMLS